MTALDGVPRLPLPLVSGDVNWCPDTKFGRQNANSPAESLVEVPLTTDFDAFYAAHYHRVVGLGYALCGDRSAAEELAQEAFADAYRRWATIGGYDDPGQWVRRVVANRAVSRWRKLARETSIVRRLRFREERFTPTMGEIDESAEAFWALVRQLPARQAQVVVLRYHDDRLIAEIADLLQCRENTVKAHLFKARRTLAAALAVSADGDLGDDGPQSTPDEEGH